MPAQGQGTMNNVTLGNDRFTYYETIGGGQGACPDADGPSGVHVTMSNTLTTPVEALELAYPLRVERYALRLGSRRRGRAPRRRRRRPRAARARGLPRSRSSASAARARPRGERGGEHGAPGRNLLNGARAAGEGDARRCAPATWSRSRRRAAAATVGRLFTHGRGRRDQHRPGARSCRSRSSAPRRTPAKGSTATATTVDGRRASRDTRSR